MKLSTVGLTGHEMRFRKFIIATVISLSLQVLSSCGSDPISLITGEKKDENKSPVSNLTAEPLTHRSISLSWKSEGSKFTAIRVDRMTADSTGYSPVVTFYGSAPTGWTDVRLLPGTTYSYRVFGITIGRRSGYSNEVSSTTFDAQGKWKMFFSQPYDFPNGHSTVWTGSELLVWGGDDLNADKNMPRGMRYMPGTRKTTPISIVGAPSARRNHLALWIGSEMIIWGGISSNYDATGGYSDQEEKNGAIYTPSSDSWRKMSIAGAPDSRNRCSVLWTGKEMIIWGGERNIYGRVEWFNTGSIYDPSLDKWRQVSTRDAPVERSGHLAIWTGSEMIIWGGL